MADVSRRVALVTGGAGQLGQAVTRELAGAGWRQFVPLHHSDRVDAVDALNRDFGAGAAHGALLDLTTERGAESAVAQAVEWGGRLDALVHLMGAWAGGMPLGAAPADLWDRMMEVNLRSAFLLASAALRPDTPHPGLRIVFVSSRAAREGRAGNAAYAVSKAGLLVLAEAITEEHGGSGVRAHCLLPDTLDTPANRAAMPDADPAGWVPPAAVARIIASLLDPGSPPAPAAIPVGWGG